MGGVLVFLFFLLFFCLEYTGTKRAGGIVSLHLLSVLFCGLIAAIYPSYSLPLFCVLSGPCTVFFHTTVSLYVCIA
jgi:hypothetical protein